MLDLIGTFCYDLSTMNDTSKNIESTPSVPIDAATVILIRDPKQGRYEIFLMRRHREQSFMGGAYVFPGGRLDEEDCSPVLASSARALGAAEAKRLLQEPDIIEETALGLFFAAVRETFEEAGVLSACDDSGEMIDLSEGEIAGRFASYRLKLHEKSLSLKELAEGEGICYALDHLLPYSHWITPEIESRRFDTRFFLMKHPRGQYAVHDTIELTESLWISPSDALESHRSGKILLMPPTLKTVEELNEFETSDQLFTAVASRSIQVILPQGFYTEDGFGVKLPHDPEYTIASHKRKPSRPDEPSRIVIKDGIWRTERVEG